MIKIIVGIVLLLLVLVVGVWVAGTQLPVAHVATTSRTIPTTPDTIFALISHFEAAPTWRSDVRAVEQSDAISGRPQFVEISSTGRLPLEVTERVPPHRLVTRITDASLPFGGTWTYEITSTGQASTVTITERGEVYSPIFRFVSRYLIGHTRTMNTYLDHLQHHFRNPTPP